MKWAATTFEMNEWRNTDIIEIDMIEYENIELYNLIEDMEEWIPNNWRDTILSPPSENEIEDEVILPSKGNGGQSWES